jgi:hypothetical protein
VPRPRDVGRVHTSVAAREATASPKPADDLQAIRLLPDARSVNRPPAVHRGVRERKDQRSGLLVPVLEAWVPR